MDCCLHSQKHNQELLAKQRELIPPEQSIWQQNGAGESQGFLMEPWKTG